MDRDVSNHPTAAQIASGEPLSETQLAALTDAQREQLTATAGEQLGGTAELAFDGGNDPAPHLLLPDAQPPDPDDESGEELDGDVEDDTQPQGADNGFV